MLRIFYFFVVTFLVTLKPAYAYIDPGTGALILQALLGGLAGLAAFIKIYWMQLKMYFSRNSSDKDGVATAEDNEKE